MESSSVQGLGPIHEAVGDDVRSRVNQETLENGWTRHLAPYNRGFMNWRCPGVAGALTRAQGLLSRRKRRFVGFTTVKKFVPLELVTPLLATQLVRCNRFVFCCKVHPASACQKTVIVLPERLIKRIGLLV